MIMVRRDERPVSAFSVSDLTAELKRYRADRQALQERLDAVEAELPEAEQRAKEGRAAQERATAEFVRLNRAYMAGQPYWEEPEEVEDAGPFPSSVRTHNEVLKIKNGVIQANPAYAESLRETGQSADQAARVREVTEQETQPAIVRYNELARQRSRLASRIRYVDDQIGQIEAKLESTSAIEADHPDLVDRIKVRLRRGV